MVTKNKIELQPQVEYTFVTGESENITNVIKEDLGVNVSGTFGQVNAKSIVYNNNSDEDNAGDRYYNVKGSLENAVDIDDNFSNNPNLFLDNSKDYKFGVEKVKQQYIVEDSNYFKKKSIKNLFNYYKNNMQHRVINPSWGFTNFNCLSFFTISKKDTTSLQNKFTRQYSHANGLFYPNRLVDGKQAYDFLKNDDMTVSFWINPRQQNIKLSDEDIHYYNPGCILHIPGLISVYILPGDSLDEENKIDKFNICVVVGTDTFENDLNKLKGDTTDNINILESSGLGRLIDDDGGTHSQNKIFFTKKNVLNHNSWHNVCIRLKYLGDPSPVTSIHGQTTRTHKWNILIDVDSINFCNQEFRHKVYQSYTDQITNSDTGVFFNNNFKNIEKSKLQGLSLKEISRLGNNIISIGNRINSLSHQNHRPPLIKLESAFKLLFSRDKDADDDNLGPFINKNISFGTDFNDSDTLLRAPETFSPSNNDRFYFFMGTQIVKIGEPRSWIGEPTDFIINDNSGAYETASLGLNADLYDIRIYSEFIEDINKKIMFKNITDFSEENLVFSVPVLYYDDYVAKSSIYNINDPGYQNIDANNVYANSQISTVNAAYRSPVNPYFLNKCFGHEVNVDAFVVEFKKKVRPNVVFGHNFNDDESFYKYTSFLFHSNNSRNEDCKLGRQTLDMLYSSNEEEKILNHEILDLPGYFGLGAGSPGDNEIATSSHSSIANFYYKNNFIMPCDNGLHYMDYSNFKGYYDNYDGFSHILNGREDLSYIDLEKVYDNEIVIEKPEKLQLISGFQELINADQTFILPEDERDLITIESGKTFRSSYNKFKNASLRNYHRINYNINDSMTLLLRYDKAAADFFVTTPLSFFRDLSNPVSRVINNNITNSIDTFSAPVFTKSINENESIPYFKLDAPYYDLTRSLSEIHSTSFCISTQVFGNEIKKESFEIYDGSLGGTLGSVKVRLKDNGKGGLYRADCNTKHADWNTVGHVLYKEGICSVLHPSLENFGRDTFKITFNSSSSINVFELNLPAFEGESNFSRNTSYDEDLRHNESAFNADESFVYITDINIHDENLNVVAKAKLAKPFAKKSSDNVLFRLKLDY